MTDDEILELHNYRAHRYEITRLSSGNFVLFDRGEVVGHGTVDSIDSLIKTGPDHYETCIESWRSLGRPSSEGSDLLSRLGLAKPTPTTSVRRI